MLLMACFHLLHQLGKGFFQFLFAQLPTVYDQRNYFLFNFFLHDLSRSFPQICRENGQALRRHHQTANAVHDFFDVHGCYLLKPLLDKSRGIFRIPPDLDGRTSVHGNLQHDFHKLVKLHTVMLLADTVVLYLLFDFCSLIKSVRQSVRRRRSRRKE